MMTMGTKRISEKATCSSTDILRRANEERRRSINATNTRIEEKARLLRVRVGCQASSQVFTQSVEAQELVGSDRSIA